MKHKIYIHIALASLLLISSSLQAQTWSATPPNKTKPASSTNFKEGHIYYIKQLSGGQKTGIIFDVEGNFYPVATFTTANGTTEWWTTWNMRSKTYSDGKLINGGIPSAIVNNSVAQFAYPVVIGDDYRTGDKYWNRQLGLLYSYKAAVNQNVDDNYVLGNIHPIRQGICPTGWHVPSTFEYDNVVNSIAMGGPSVAGAQMKSGTVLNGNFRGPTNGTSASADRGGFDILFTGWAFDGKGAFSNSAYLLTSSADSSTSNWYVYVVDGWDSASFSMNVQAFMYSVRCKKD